MITVAHSPDADDFFLFWPLRTGMIDSEGFGFTFTEHDTQQLNEAAITGKYDICAISVAVYPKIAERYAILSSGASVGRNYGPVVVSLEKVSKEALAGKRIGVPGKDTTAALLFARLFPNCELIETPLTPYDEVFRRLRENEIDAAVLIHEGQIAFAERGLHQIEDLGAAWQKRSGLPIPLGVNVIRKSLGADSVQKLSALAEKSARFASDNRAKILPALFDFTQRRLGKLASQVELGKYLDMYANADSISLPDDCREAIASLLGKDVRVQYA